MGTSTVDCVQGVIIEMKRAGKKCLIFVLLGMMLLFSFAGTAFGFGRGAKGPDVYAVQGMLKSLGYYAGKIDGVYGSLTETGVRLFQQKYGLPVTGAVDGKTLESILWAYGNLKIPRNQPAPTPSKPSDELTAEERQMLDLVNGARKDAGLPALAVDPELVKTARLKSQDMVDNNYFSHQSPTYGSPFDMMKKFGISYNLAGENIACNRSVTAAHQAFMNSEGHRANILNKDFDYIGIGIADGGPCGKMFTQQFVGR
jgi:uncharacterized YkwD family protein